MSRPLSWQRLSAAIFLVFIMGIPLLLPRPLPAQNKPTWSAQEKPIAEQIGGLRRLPDDVRARTTTDLALLIRELPITPNKLRLAGGLANLSTEGDFGHDTLQEVAKHTRSSNS
jgi:hypothetical protein